MALTVRGRLSAERGTQIVDLLDLSQTGARLNLMATYALSEARLEWLDYTATGKVVWQDKRTCGLHFDAEIPLEWVTRTRSPR